MVSGVLFDVDGTLVDTNYLHVVAWSDAFRVCGYDIAMCDILPFIGQGSARLVKSLIGQDDDEVVEAHSDLYAPRLHAVQPLDGAADLLRRTKAEGLQVVVATSASKRDANLLCDGLGVANLIDHLVTSDDAEQSKPDPDILVVATERAGLEPANCVFVGDSKWDVEAARSAGMDCVGVLTGGIPEVVLRQAGAVAVYKTARVLLDDFTSSPLGRLERE